MWDGFDTKSGHFDTESDHLDTDSMTKIHTRKKPHRL